MDTVWKTNGVKRVDCCPYCTLAFCSVISISTQGLITPLHYTMSRAPGSRLRPAPFDWLWLGFSAQPHPKGLAGKQEEGPETAHAIPDSTSNHPTKLDPSVASAVGAADEWKNDILVLFPTKTCLSIFNFQKSVFLMKIFYLDQHLNFF